MSVWLRYFLEPSRRTERNWSGSAHVVMKATSDGDAARRVKPCVVIGKCSQWRFRSSLSVSPVSRAMLTGSK